MHINYIVGYMKSKVYQHPRPRNAVELDLKVRHVWDNLDPNAIQRVCRTYPKRVQKCIAVQGRHFEKEHIVLQWVDPLP